MSKGALSLEKILEKVLHGHFFHKAKQIKTKMTSTKHNTPKNERKKKTNRKLNQPFFVM